ncbi:MAG: hypothetical protein BWY85_02444 [Firmicutes bacterium ADurb.Bin506]|nr:MAG: hypothetical protein BWY85_02444 [Firmicutes bacterium ADurb.Bin506]
MLATIARPSTEVEQAPYTPMKGAGTSAAVKLAVTVWLSRSPATMMCRSSGSRPAFLRATSMASLMNLRSAFSGVRSPNMSSSTTQSNHLARGPFPSMGPAMVLDAMMDGRLGNLRLPPTLR